MDTVSDTLRSPLVWNLTLSRFEVSAGQVTHGGYLESMFSDFFSNRDALILQCETMTEFLVSCTGTPVMTIVQWT